MFISHLFEVEDGFCESLYSFIFLARHSGYRTELILESRINYKWKKA